MEHKRLTAEQVKALEPGTRVGWMHYDRHGELNCTRGTVVRSGRGKRLNVCTRSGDMLMTIFKLDGEREWYEEGWRW